MYDGPRVSGCASNSMPLREVATRLTCVPTSSSPWKYITIRWLAGSTWTSGEAMCGRRDLQLHVVGHQRAPLLPTRFAPRNLIRRGDRGLDQKRGLRKLQAAGRINCPGPGRVIGVGEADVAPLLVGRIEVVMPETRSGAFRR